jgi:hypothetical protein
MGTAGEAMIGETARESNLDNVEDHQLKEEIARGTGVNP